MCWQHLMFSSATVKLAIAVESATDLPARDYGAHCDPWVSVTIIRFLAASIVAIIVIIIVILNNNNHHHHHQGQKISATKTPSAPCWVQDKNDPTRAQSFL